MPCIRTTSVYNYRPRKDIHESKPWNPLDAEEFDNANRKENFNIVFVISRFIGD